MSMLPQPPPDAPAPPPSEEALRSRRWWRGIWITGAFSILFLLLAGLSAPMFIRGSRRADLTEAINNARQIGLAMIEFQTEYGKFPDSTTIAAVQAATGKIVPLGTKTSNDFFRQLPAAGITQSESMFYAKTKGTLKPDGLIEGIRFLEKGECGFTYLLGATDKDNRGRPIVVAPMIPGTDRFDPKALEGKAVILRLGGIVSRLPIDKAGHAILDGRNLMDPHHPIWSGHAPAIAWPDL